ncbi:MAG: glycosyltransferase [Alphaproteobacteria bacterium]|nr:glycosyltransferase [Alphaproteobacteria bacterium]
MPRVTIGVPVYNSESLLEQCLENLAAQSFRDFKVIILDNASTDGTAAIAKDFSAKDARFTYLRQPFNKGARQNFVDVLGMARTPYFMWRAYDDLSDVNFIQEAVRLLDDNPNAALAVGCVISEKKRRRAIWRFRARHGYEPSLAYTTRLLFQSHASWIYGLFRTEDLNESLSHVDRDFPHLMGFDHLTIFPFLITHRVAGSDRTSFIQRFNEPPSDAVRPVADPDQMQKLRYDYLSYSQAKMRELIPDFSTRLYLSVVLRFYAGRAHRWSKILSARWRATLRGKSGADRIDAD